MCGGCTRAVGHDQWSDLLSSTRARWQSAKALNSFFRETRHPARVTAVPGGWTVTGATGRSVVTDTASELWAAVRAMGDVDLDALERLRRAASSREVAAVAQAGTTALTAPALRR